MRFSRSRLQAVTADGCVIETWFRVLTAANLRVALGEEQNSWKEKRIGNKDLLSSTRMVVN